MVMILLSHRVRARVPEPCSQVVEETAPRRRPGRPPGSATPSAAKVLHETVAGIKQATFPHLPVEIWNRLASGVGDWLKTVAAKLDAAYSEGIDGHVVAIMDELLPEAALALGRSSMEAFVATERGFLGSKMSCDQCRGCLEYQGDVAKSIKTRVGEIETRRAYYHCSCGNSACPLDVTLGVDGAHAVMPSLQDTVAWLAASMTFPETAKVLDKLCPSKFSLKAVETVTATVAAQVQEAQSQEIQAVLDDPSAAAARNGSLEPGVAVVEVDGGFVRVRDHTEPSREFKLSVLGQLQETERPEKDAEPGEVDKGVKLVEKTFVGHFADPDTVFTHIQTEYFRRGFHKLQTLHGLSDGGSWIMPRIELIAQEGQEISLVLDWWHADQRVAQAANALHGAGTEAAARWRTDARFDLWNDKLGEFFLKLQQATDNANTPEARETLQEHHDYFAARRHLLRYKECRERGLPIGSGAIEGGIRFIGKDRLDRTGMRWKVSGAEAILQLRCVKYSDRWDELAAKRLEARRQKYQSRRAAWNKAA